MIYEEVEAVTFHAIFEYKQALILIYTSTILILQMQPSATILLFEGQYAITPLTQFAKFFDFNLYNNYCY